MTGPQRHLAAVPSPDAPATPGAVAGPWQALPKPRPTPAPPKPAGYHYPSNPLLTYTYGPDPEGTCPACKWIHGEYGELCPHHVRWDDFTESIAAQLLDDAKGDAMTWPTSSPVYERGARVWMHGLLECRITNRYWPRAGTEWHYVATAVKGGATVHGREAFFTATCTHQPASDRR